MIIMHLSEKTLSSELIYKGRIIDLRKDTAELENGMEATRELVVHSGGVCVVPITDNGEILFVKQFRYPFKEVLIEIPAGKLNPGEDHYECGKRELSEETGADCRIYKYLGVMYPSVAYLTEKIHMYLAAGLTFSERHLDEDEFLDVMSVPMDKAYEMVMSGEIKDGITQVAVLKAWCLLKNDPDFLKK